MKNIKVLWLSNTPGMASEHLDPTAKLNTGSWMRLINERVAAKTHLHVVYPGKATRSFVYKNTHFIEFPLFRRTLVNRVLARYWLPVYDLDSIKRRVLQIISDINPDIIHVFGTEYPWGIVQNNTTIPVCISIQGNLHAIRDFFFQSLAIKDILKYGNLRDWMEIFRQYRFFVKGIKWERAIFQHSDYLIGRTDWDRRLCLTMAPQAQYFYNDETLRSHFYENVWEPPKSRDRTLRLFTISRESPYKGVSTIFKSSLLLDRLSINYRWEVGGIEESGSLVKLMKRKYGATPRGLFFLGVLGENEIIQRIKQAHLYVMPSHIENGSIALSEAMILGIPVITTLAGGTSSRLKDGKEGVMIQAGDAHSMAGAILELKKDYNKAINYGRSARERANERHNPDQIVSGLLDIYKTILESKSNVDEPMLCCEKIPKN